MRTQFFNGKGKRFDISSAEDNVRLTLSNAREIVKNIGGIVVQMRMFPDGKSLGYAVLPI